jgi:SAM-dependent methyltransferase
MSKQSANPMGQSLIHVVPSKGSIYLNLGCGFSKRAGWINVDKYDNCDPEFVHGLDVFPYPWSDDSVDGIVMMHILEHLDNWWGCIEECARILKPGAKLEIHVPDESSRTALTYRDHNHVFSAVSFHGIQERDGWGTNAWAHKENELVPLKMISFLQVPHGEYMWMLRWPFKRVLAFCANHLRNFIWEQIFIFKKVGDRNE